MTMLLVSDIKLRDDYKPCRSITPIMYHVKTEEHLKRLVGRNYRLPTSQVYKEITKDDKHLIGKKILVKSPMTCASHKGICCDCYGSMMFHTNQGGVGVGAFAG